MKPTHYNILYNGQIIAPNVPVFALNKKKQELRGIARNEKLMKLQPIIIKKP